LRIKDTINLLLTSVVSYLLLCANTLARFPVTNDLVINTISFASSGVDTCPTIIIFYHSSLLILSVCLLRPCCTTVTQYLYACYPKINCQFLVILEFYKTFKLLILHLRLTVSTDISGVFSSNIWF